jgi:hypothetical protein
MSTFRGRIVKSSIKIPSKVLEEESFMEKDFVNVTLQKVED